VLEHFEAPPFSLLVGAPAKVKRTYDDQDACRARAAKQAQQYAARAQAYRRSLCECIYGVAAVASFLAAAVTEIYLSNVCSCQEILRGNGRGQTAMTPSPRSRTRRRRRRGRRRTTRGG
jgi:hypothetical protein